MPAEAVALDLNVGDIEKDDIAKAREIMVEFGFHAHPYDDGPIGGIINYQPFGHTDDNIELVEECVQRLSDAFPDAEVSYEIRKNRDAGRVVGKRCYIQIEVRSSDGATDEQRVTTDYRTDNSEEASDGHSRVTSPVEDGESGDGPEWRAFDSESGETETVESTEGESDERDTRVGAPIKKEELTNTIDWKKRDSEDTVSERGTTDVDDSQDPPETVDEWEMWYPCPTCESTKLNQIIESHLYVSATEDGSYGGKQAGVDEYNYVECDDCGEVLLDEIGEYK